MRNATLLRYAVLGLLPAIAASMPQLLRFREAGSPVKGLSCIITTPERVLAPGVRGSIHLYDTNCLAAFRHAMSSHGRFGQVVLDMEGGARAFKLRSVGCELQVLGWQPATHTSTLGDSSASVIADVLAVRRFHPSSVVQFEPYLSVESRPFEEQTKSAEAGTGAAILDEAGAVGETNDSSGVPIAADADADAGFNADADADAGAGVNGEGDNDADADVSGLADCEVRAKELDSLAEGCAQLKRQLGLPEPNAADYAKVLELNLFNHASGGDSWREERRDGRAEQEPTGAAGEIDRAMHAPEAQLRQLLIVALASTRVLPPEPKWEVLERRDPFELVEAARLRLEHEHARLIAMLALQQAGVQEN